MADYSMGGGLTLLTALEKSDIALASENIKAVAKVKALSVRDMTPSYCRLR